MKTESEHIKMDLKLSPKLIALCEWEKISEVNARLDNKESPNQVYQFIKKSGFAISIRNSADFSYHEWPLLNHILLHFQC